MRAYELLMEGKNPHLVHLEDLVLDKGYVGAQEALRLATGVRNVLSRGKGKRSQVTVKWDGSPAIFAGIDPEDGKFFVGTKSALSKGTPRRIKSPGDIKKYYNDSPELGEKLLAAFKHLRGLGIKDVLQGDLMFTDDDVKRETVNGEEVLTFTPNTITYAVPADSALAKKIEQAKLGIIFHTAYVGGETIQDADKTFDIDINSLKKDPNVWYDDATYKDYTGIASLTPEEDNTLRQEIIAAKARLTQIGRKQLDEIVKYSEFKKYIQVFFNRKVREGEHIRDPQAFTAAFLEFYKEQTLKDIDKLKSDKAKEGRHAKIEAKEAWIEENKEAIYKIIDLHSHLIDIKMIIIDKLNTLDGLQTFVRSGNGYEVTNPEGFVAIGHDDGAVKLVNRLEFSRQNFNRRGQ